MRTSYVNEKVNYLKGDIAMIRKISLTGGILVLLQGEIHPGCLVKF